MSLIKCFECKKEVSSIAKACPYCGCPINPERYNCRVVFKCIMLGKSYSFLKIYRNGALVSTVQPNSYYDMDISSVAPKEKIVVEAWRGRFTNDNKWVIDVPNTNNTIIQIVHMSGNRWGFSVDP